MRNTAWILAGTLGLTMAPAMAADGDGTAPGSNPLSWARWQGRLSLGSASTSWRLGAENPAPQLSSASLMGDYYFNRSLTGPQQLGGFRATSGLIFGPRATLNTGQPSLATGNAFSIVSRSFGQAAMPYANDAANDSATLPYLGVGYTNLAPRSGWGFSADLGLVAKSTGSAGRLGRSLYGGQSLDDALREMRMTPLLQLGVSYAF